MAYGDDRQVASVVAGLPAGEAFVFDDTIEHEAWNDSDEPCAVLVLDTWNPAVTPAERVAVTQLTAAVGEFYGELPDFSAL